MSHHVRPSRAMLARPHGAFLSSAACTTRNISSLATIGVESIHHGAATAAASAATKRAPLLPYFIPLPSFYYVATFLPPPHRVIATRSFRPFSFYYRANAIRFCLVGAATQPLPVPASRRLSPW